MVLRGFRTFFKALSRLKRRSELKESVCHAAGRAPRRGAMTHKIPRL
ncbi:MAG: hypothetical protein ACETVN_04305 [Asgard group archaeon]